MALTYAQAVTKLKAKMNAHLKLRGFASVDATNWLGLASTWKALNVGDYDVASSQGMTRSQQLLSKVLEPDNLLNAIEGELLDLAAAMGYTETDPIRILWRWYDYAYGDKRSTGTITGITQANPAVVTSASHGLSDGDNVRIPDGGGMTELDGRDFKVANSTASTFELSGEDSTGHTAYSSGGDWVQIDRLDDREATFGTWTADADNVGDGAIHRITVDENGYPIQIGHIESKTAEVIADQNLVDKHAETIRIEGTKAEPDHLKVVGSGLRWDRTALTIKNSEQFVENPTFSSINGETTASVFTPTAVTDITGWTLGSTTSVTVRDDIAYRDLVGETKTHAVFFGAANTMTQVINQKRRANFKRHKPYYRQIAFYRKDACDRTLTLHFGGQSVSVDVSTITDATWSTLKLTLDKTAYFKNFNEDDLDVQIQVSGGTTGEVGVDTMIVEEMDEIDGIPTVVVGGATPFQTGDKFTLSDTQADATKGLIHLYLFLAGTGVTMPNTSDGNESIADPT